MLYPTALLLLAGLALAEPQATATKTKAATKPAATGAAAKAPAAAAKSDFAWVVPAAGASWGTSQGQSVSWTGTTPAVFDILLINQNPSLQPIAQMPVAQVVPIAWKNITLTMSFGPATNFALIAVDHTTPSKILAQSPWFSVTGGPGCGKWLGFPLASPILATMPSTANAAACPATSATAAPAAAGAAATGGAAAQLPGLAGTSTTFVAGASGSGIVAAVSPSSGSHLAISGLAACLLAALAIFLA